MLGLRRGSLLAKSDIQHAYRQIPVHPNNRLLLGMRGGETSFSVMPRSRSASAQLRSFSQLLLMLCNEWSRPAGVTGVFHYMDDFVI